MGAWNETIYGNDIALDLVGKIYDLIDNGYTPVDVLCQLLDNSFDSNELLVLADFELFATGKIFFTSDVIKIIDKLLLDTTSWTNPKKREKELLNFKQKILDSNNSNVTNKTNEEIKKWLKDK